jgi:hypothetical protein
MSPRQHKREQSVLTKGGDEGRVPLVENRRPSAEGTLKLRDKCNACNMRIEESKIE